MDGSGQSRRANKDGLIVPEQELRGFFFDRLQEVNQKSSAPILNELLYHASLVMEHFTHSEHYFERTEDGRIKERPLGLRLLESALLPPKQREKALREVGDTSLFLCGFFSGSIQKKFSNQSYYQQVGQMAYDRLNVLVPEAYEVSGFFSQASALFGPMATLMSIVSGETSRNLEEGLLILISQEEKKILAS